MKISPNWLREFIDLNVETKQLAQDLTAAGLAVELISGKGDDLVFDIEITTNRVDAMNHYGIARECSAIYDLDLNPIEPKLPAAKGKANFSIELPEPQGCARYTAQIIRGIKIAPSPARITHRLDLVEARPINNGVDASNYTLVEMGHPTHAFDLDTLEGGKIIVRRARAGEKLKTLDGAERNLHPDDLVIADAARPVALAGLMGGFETMITDKTRNVLIESAWFDPVSIRPTARRHGMHTDASHRFERGADWAATTIACRRVAQLILETGGGELEGGLIDAIGRRIQRDPIHLQRAQINRILGFNIAEQDVLRIMRRLGFDATPGRASIAANPSSAPVGVGGSRAAIAEEVADYTVEIPSWRLDVGREIDLIEEVARIYGYNSFPNTLPAFAGAVVETADAEKDAALRSTLLALGFNEAVSLSFISSAEAQQFSTAIPVALENPISEEAALMRTSLLPNMINMLAYNLNRGINDVRLFEAAHVYELVGTNTEERKQIAIGATGRAIVSDVHQPGRSYSFFDLKGEIESLLEIFQHQSVYFEANNAASYYHPYRYARAVLDGSMVARLGQLHPEIAATRKLRQDAYVAEIYLDRLYRHELRQIQYQPLSRYPAVDRDFSFVFHDSVIFKKVRTAVDTLQIAELRSFQPLEIFRGGTVPAGHYSILLRAQFQSLQRTLRDDEVALWSQQIIETLKALGGIQRA
jgi:phenylalanyl-tRNA synthetase beta chain